MTDSDFSPTDAEGLVAWFARAESHATRLRRRLATLGDSALWRDLPSDPAPGSVPQRPDSSAVAQGTARPAPTPGPRGDGLGGEDRTGGSAMGEAKRRKLAGSYPTPTKAGVDLTPMPPEHPLVLALQADRAGDAAALAEALAAIDRMPDGLRERLLSTFAAFRRLDDAL